MNSSRILIGLVAALSVACSSPGNTRGTEGVVDYTGTTQPSIGSVQQIAPPMQPTPTSEKSSSKCDESKYECSTAPIDSAFNISYLAMVNCDLVTSASDCDAPTAIGESQRFSLHEPICVIWQEVGDPPTEGIHIQVARGGGLILTDNTDAFGKHACRAVQLRALPPGQYQTIIESTSQRWPVGWSIVDEPPVVYAGPDQTVFRNSTVTVTGTWTDPTGSYDGDYTWTWDLNGDGIVDESGSAAYGESIVRSTSFVDSPKLPLTFMVTDTSGNSAVGYVRITVENRAPYVTDVTLSTYESTAVEFTLSGTDEDGDPLDYVLASPRNGTIDGSPPNLRYIPYDGYVGRDSFTYVANDGLVDSSNVGAVSVVVNPRKSPPVAGADSVETYEDNGLVVSVLDNDSTGPSDPYGSLTVNGISDLPAYGTATINLDGTITYSPNRDFSGADDLMYEVCDGNGACSFGNVTIQVYQVNDPPSSIPFDIMTFMNTAVRIDVGAGTYDVDGNVDRNSIAVASYPSYGYLTDLGGGVFEYVPVADFVGKDTWNYSICDTELACATLPVYVVVQ